MVDRLLAKLIASDNEAADDVLLEALRIGDEPEKRRALDALIQRAKPTGVFGLLREMDKLSHELRLEMLQRAGELFHVLPEAGRSEDFALRTTACRVIALGRVGKLSYVLSENLHHPEESVSAAAADALVSLARHIASETRRLQNGRLPEHERKVEYRKLLEIRADVESAVYRALDLHKGARGQELLRAGLLLSDWPGSKTLSILSTSRHGGVSPMVKRLQQSPDAEHVDAFLLGATHGQLRSQFGGAFAGIDAGPVLDGIVRRTYWIKDYRMEICMRQVSRGAWWAEPSLIKDLARREARDGAKIAEWLCVSGSHDVVQDEKLIKVHEAVSAEPAARLRLFRLVMARPRGASLTLLRRFMEDPDETIQRMAVREIVRRKPADHNTVLLGVMKTAAYSTVRRVAGRAISAGAFENFYERFEKLDPPTRQRAGKAVFKLLPDAALRLSRRLRTGPAEQRIRAVSIAQELGVVDEVREEVLTLASHENPKVRSKAVGAMGSLKDPAPDVLLDKALGDPDARVRANAIEVLEATRREDYLPMIAARVRSAHNRERANAIKALHTLKVEAAIPQLVLMMRDPRPEHRISALWAARHVGVYRLLAEVVRVAREESDPKVKRYAVASVRVAAEKVSPRRADTAPAVEAVVFPKVSTDGRKAG